MDMTGADTNTLEDKIEAAQKKRTDLIDLYTCLLYTSYRSCIAVRPHGYIQFLTAA